MPEKTAIPQPGESKAWFYVKKYAKRYFVDAMGAMALGLFSSLIIGLIISQIAKIPMGIVSETLIAIADVAKSGPVVGAAIGVAVAWGLKGNKPLTIFSCAIAGAFGYTFGGGGPVGAYIGGVVGAEFGRLVAGKTKVDIVLVPLVVILAGGAICALIGPPIGAFMIWLGAVVNDLTILQPLPMGILVAVVMGVILTLPISSAAIAISIGLSGLAAGAATVGCCAQMVGYAVISFRENRWGGLVAQGVGTSMLQVPNLFKKPVLWIPPIITSAILGPLSTMVFKMENIPAGAGMGTSGLVGQFGTWDAMFNGSNALPLLGEILLLHVVLPAAISLAISEIMRKKGWIKFGDLKLPDLSS